MTLTPRQRAYSFLSGEAPSPPVCMQMYLGLFLEAQRREALAAVYREMLGGATEMTLSFTQVSEAELDAWERVWSSLRTPPAWMPIRGWPARSADGTRILQREGRILTAAPGGEPVDILAAPNSSSRDVWDRSDTVDLNALSQAPTLEEAMANEWAEHPRRAVERWREEFLLCGHLGSPFGGGYALLGFGGMMEMMLSDPEALERIIRNQLGRLITSLEVYAEAGVECVFVEEWFSSSDLISEADYLRFSFPFTNRLLQRARDLGLRTVYYYCGAIEDRLEHIARLPADALAFEESKKAFEVDLGAVREVVGADRPLLGNIDATYIRDADEGGLRRAIEAQFGAAGPMLATSAGSPLTLDTGVRKLDLMVELTEECSV